MCYKCGVLEKNLFVPKKNSKRRLRQAERDLESISPKVSLDSLHDDLFVVIFLYAGIRSTTQLSLCSVYYSARFNKEQNDAFWELLQSRTSVLYQSSLLHRACFPVNFTLCEDDISLIMPLVETPATWREYFVTAIAKHEWLCKVQQNCIIIQDMFIMNHSQALNLSNSIFSLNNDVMIIRHHGKESPSFQSLYAYDNMEMLRLRSQSRCVHTTSSGCIVEELTYRHDWYDAEAGPDISFLSTPPVSLCVLSAISGDICWRDVVEGVVERQFLFGVTPSVHAGMKVKVESIFRQEMPFEVYYLELQS